MGNHSNICFRRRAGIGDFLRGNELIEINFAHETEAVKIGHETSFLLGEIVYYSNDIVFILQSEHSHSNYSSKCLELNMKEHIKYKLACSDVQAVNL